LNAADGKRRKLPTRRAGAQAGRTGDPTTATASRPAIAVRAPDEADPLTTNGVTKPSAEEVYRLLQARIVDGLLCPGERMREVAIAEDLGISRTPVREALRRLESDGLLTYRPHRGMVIRRLDHQAVTELYAMREILEGAAAGLAARHASDAEIAALCDLIEEQAAGRLANVEAARLNKLFHQALYRSARNQYLIRTLDSLAVAMSLLGRTTLSLKNRQEEAVVEHRAIVEAIDAHDAEAAERAARRHIHAAHKARLRVMFEDGVDA
jgi:DNA-binding GntR family transcriptional regulator